MFCLVNRRTDVFRHPGGRSLTTLLERGDGRSRAGWSFASGNHSTHRPLGTSWSGRLWPYSRVIRWGWYCRGHESAPLLASRVQRRRVG